MTTIRPIDTYPSQALKKSNYAKFHSLTCHLSGSFAIRLLLGMPTQPPRWIESRNSKDITKISYMENGKITPDMDGFIPLRRTV